MDNDNIFYAEYVKDILNNLKTGNSIQYQKNDILGEIANKMVKVCSKIKDYTGGKLSPYPV